MQLRLLGNYSSNRYSGVCVPALALVLLAFTVCPSGCKKKKGGGDEAAKQVADKEQLQQREADLAAFDYVWNTVNDKHWDKALGGVDWAAVRDELRPKVEQAASKGEARQIMEEMLGRLRQSHFGIVPATAYEELEQSKGGADDGSAAGGAGDTGIEVRVVDDQALVWRVAEAGPAASAGVGPGWRIVSIEGKAVADSIARIKEAFADSTLQDWMLSRAIEGRLSGDDGTVVEVEFDDAGGNKVAKKIARGEPKGKRVVLGNMPGLYLRYESRTAAPGIGYIAFSVFLDPATTMQSFAKDMAAFAETKGIIIDLRGNPGGLGGMAMGMGGWFVSDSSKSLGTMTTRDTALKFVLNPRPDPYPGKVAILIDGLSGSTSEILAAGLRDLGLARLFGTRSGGAALPSIFERLPNGDGFQYAFGNYVSANGDVLEGKGVVPDQEVRLTREALLAGKDPVLDAAIAWIQN